MNSEEFYKRMDKCSSIEELQALKQTVSSDIQQLESKKTETNTEILKYIKNNTERFCKNIFKGESEDKLENMKNSEYLQQATKSLCKHLGIEEKYSFQVLSTWNGFKLQGMKKRLHILEARITKIEELEKKEQDNFFKYKKEVIQEVEQIEW